MSEALFWIWSIEKGKFDFMTNIMVVTVGYKETDSSIRIIRQKKTRY